MVGNEYLKGLPKFAMLEFIFGLPEILRGRKGGRGGPELRKKNSKRKTQ